LDVGVDTIIDEARVAFVFVLPGPECLEQGSEADFAGRIFLSICQLREDFADGPYSPAPDVRHQPRFLQRYARHVVVFGRVVPDLANTGLQNLCHETLARTAAASGSRAGRNPGDALASLNLNRVDDLLFAHAVAIANLRVVRKVRGLQQRNTGR